MRYIYFVIFFLIIGNTGCNNNPTNTDEHSHEHNNEFIQKFTKFSDRYELFVEFPAPVKGEVIEFTAHFTDLTDYKPVTEGKVTVSLIKDNSGIRKTVDSPERPGIFTPSLQPTLEGIYKLMFEINFTGGSDKFVIEGIEVYKNNAELHDKFHIDETNNEGNTVFLKEDAWKIDFSTKTAVRTTIHEVVKSTGKILPAQGDEQMLSSKANGIVLFNNKKLLSGTFVKKGEVLFNIIGEDIGSDNIEMRFKKAKLNLEKYKTEYNRLKELVKIKAVSEKEYLDSKIKFEKAQIEFEKLSENYGAKGQKITAPITGYIKHIYITHGQYLDIGNPIVSIAQNQKLVLEADIPQEHFSNLNNIYSANFTTPYDNKTYRIEDLNGKLASYSRYTDNSTYYSHVYFEIDNAANLIPGSFIEVFLKTNTQHEVITVPKSAITEEFGNFYVFVQKNGESYKKQDVKLGVSDGINVQVTSGLKENDRIVVKGVTRLKLESMNSSLPDAHAGHSH